MNLTATISKTFGENLKQCGNMQTSAETYIKALTSCLRQNKLYNAQQLAKIEISHKKFRDQQETEVNNISKKFE